MLWYFLLMMAAEQGRTTLPMPPPPPPRPLGIPDRPPDWRVVETRYQCAGEQVTFTVRYEVTGRAEFVAGRRARGGLTSTNLRRLTERLREFDSVSSISAVCAADVHTLRAVGLVGGRNAEMMIVWTPYAISAGPPERRSD